MNLRDLAAYFLPEDIEWKPITISKKTGKGLAAAYITNRAIMARLDDVCGPGGWKNEYRPGPQGGVVCGISIRVVREDGAAEWVTKWDGADNTDIEAVKGGLSNAMRRAGVMWGIGRYLYEVPSRWLEVDDFGKFKVEPQMPRQFLPDASRRSSGDGARSTTPAPPTPAALPPAPKERTPAQEVFYELAVPLGLTADAFKFLLDEAKATHADEAVALGIVRDELERKAREREASVASARAELAGGPDESLFGPDRPRHGDPA